MGDQSKFSLTHPLRAPLIIAHREKRKIAMSSHPTPPTEKQSIRPEPYKMMGDSFPESFRAKQSKTGRQVIIFEDLAISLGAAKGRSIEKKNNWDRLYIDFTIIEEPFIENELSIGDFTTPKNFLIENTYKQVCTLQVHGLPGNDEVQEIFAVGTRIDVLNPSLTFDYTSPGHNVHFIVDERMGQSIFPIKKFNKMCRYCGRENAKSNCRTCNVPYCNRKCQIADGKNLKHELVCQAVTSKLDAANAASSDEEIIDFPELAKLKLTDPDPEVSLATKSYLMDKSRISRILNFRAKYNFIFKREILSPPRESYFPLKYKVDILREMEEYPRNPKPITLKDMQCDAIYENRTIVLTIIDEPLIGISFTHFLVEDENKDVTMLSVNGLFQPGIDERTLTHQQFLYRVGTAFCVMHPFYKLGEGDGLPMIRVDHEKTIKPYLLGWRTDMCTYCGDQNAKRKCRACKRLFCGDECKSNDKKVLNHNMICETGPAPMTYCVV